MVCTTTVRDLRAGQVISLPGAGQDDPAVVHAISEPSGVRFLILADLSDGEPVGGRLCLGLDRSVVVHEVAVCHHSYRNTSDAAVPVAYGRRTETVEPGTTVHYTGAANPQAFPEETFEHSVRPVEVVREQWPL